jgi:TRAP-type C4-dicarboxylate transport system permease small subunit
LWYTLLISFLAIASLIFVIISLDYSHRKQSIKWAYAPFLVFGILGCIIFIVGTFRLQRARETEEQNYIQYRNTPHPSRIDALNQYSQ